MRRLAATLATVVLLAAAIALADEAGSYPARPVKVIVPNPPAGGVDNLARPVAELLGHKLGQAFVIENRGGGAGVIGVEAAAKARKDGYTLMIAINAPLVVLPHIRKLPYDATKDLVPVAILSNGLSGLAVHPSVPAQTFAAFLDYCRAHPGAVHYASAGTGSITHIRNELINRLGGLGMVHVPYRGNGEALADLLAGTIQMMGESSTLAYARQGQLRLLAIVGGERHPDFPDVPAVKELLPASEAPTWVGLFAPAGTPEAILRKLNAAAVALLREPDTAQRLLTIGHRVQFDTPEEAAARMARDYASYGKLVTELGIEQE